MDIKKKCWFLFLTTIITITVAACGRQEAAVTPNPPQQSPSPTRTLSNAPIPTPSATEIIFKGTVSIWHSWDESKVPALVQIIADFQTTYPDILFDVLYIPDEDLKSRYEKETREGQGPSILLGPASWGPNLYDNALITDLASMANKDLFSNINQAALAGANYKDKLIGLPYTIQGTILYRNQDILTIQPNTFEDLVTLSQTATQGDTIGAMLERGFPISGAHLEGIGGNLMDEFGAPAFNNEKGVAWVEMLVAFEQSGPTDYMSTQDLEYFKQGRIGWIIDGTWNLGELIDSLESDILAIDPWPAYQEGHLSGYVTADNLFLNPNIQANNKIAAQLFIEYFLSTEAQSRLVDVGLIPSLTNVQFDDSSADGELISQCIEALAGGVPYPNSPYMDIYNVQMDIALRSVFEQGVPIEIALQTAYDAILAEMAENIPTPSPSP